MRLFQLGILLSLCAAPIGAKAESPSSPAAPALSYADLADLALAAPVAAEVRIDRAVRLDPGEAGMPSPGRTRYYVEADVVSLIRGAGGVPTRVSYLADVPNDADGDPVKPRKKDAFLVFASPVAGRPGELRLVAPDAQIPFTPARADTVRDILRQATQADAPPQIVGIGRAFSVPGSLPGESETQIFLEAADGRPVSLTILRRPGQEPRWAVALSEIVDEAAAPPRPNSLLWYRLACTLPPTLPEASFQEARPERIDEIKADYQLVLKRLGPCVRNRKAD